MTEIAEREVAGWPAGELLPMRPRMQRLTLEIVLRAIFGVREADRLDRLRAALESLLDWARNPSRMALVALAGPDRVGRIPSFRRALEPVDAIIAEEIERRRRAPDLDERTDILSMLLGARHESGEPMSGQELRDELMTLLIAGHETTATALSWALERLARDPAAWARLREGEEEYRDAVIKETLRLRPVLPIVLRRLTAPLEIAGYELPAGVSVAPCIHLMHRRPDIYPEPHVFRPERFLERPAGTYTWIPFGGGVRRCLGASFALFEMSTVLRVIADRVRALEPDGPRAEPVARRMLTLVPGRDGSVRLRREPAPALAGAGQRGATSSD
jgi:cytochrome P450